MYSAHTKHQHQSYSNTYFILGFGELDYVCNTQQMAIVGWTERQIIKINIGKQ